MVWKIDLFTYQSPVRKGGVKQDCMWVFGQRQSTMRWKDQLVVFKKEQRRTGHKLEGKAESD